MPTNVPSMSPAAEAEALTPMAPTARRLDEDEAVALAGAQALR